MDPTAMHSSTPPSRRLAGGLALLAAVALLGALVVACGGGDSDAGKPDREPRAERVGAKQASKLPNVIFIYTDDQEDATFRPKYMPRTFDLLAKGGTDFSEFVVATPLCCPSRATYMTGEYPHNSGVFSNRRGYSNLREKFSTLPIWMKLGGYRTAWVGKYLQGYTQGVKDPLENPPGIDEWYGTYHPKYYDYEMGVNGKSRKYGDRPRDYYTNVITKISTDLIRKQSKRDRPLYMTINNLAPHRGSGGRGRCADLVVPAPRDRNAYRKAKLPRGPGFREKDVSDKPPFVPREPLSQKRVRKLELAYQCRLASLRGVDRGVAAIYKELKRAGELSNSVIIYTSDNGIMQGEHRTVGKNIPYDEGLRQPLAIFAGRKALGGRQVGSVDQLVANVDFAPTILDFGKAKPCIRRGDCRTIDGRSLVPLMKGRDGGFARDREVLIEGGKAGGDCSYAGIRTPRLSYLEYARERPDGTCQREWATELYDHDGSLSGKADPNELENLSSKTIPRSSDPEVVAERKRLDRRLAELRECSGKSCR